MPLNAETVRALLKAADLHVTGDMHVSEATVACTVSSPRWQRRRFGVVMCMQGLQRRLASAAKDSPDLWPGRDPADGAVALVATQLDAAYATASSTPRRITMARDGTVAVESDETPQPDLPPGAYYWSAEAPSDHHQ